MFYYQEIPRHRETGMRRAATKRGLLKVTDAAFAAWLAGLRAGDAVACRFGRERAKEDPTRVRHPDGAQTSIDCGVITKVDGPRMWVRFGGGVEYQFVGGVLRNYTHELEPVP